MPRLHPLKELIVLNEKPRSARLRPLRIGKQHPDGFSSVAFPLNCGTPFHLDRWNSHYSRQKANLDPCLDAARHPNRYTGYTDQEGHPIARSAAPTLPVQPVTDTDESCRKSWVVQPTEEYLETAVVVLFPFALYGFGRVLVWIRNGFRTGTAGSN